MNNTSRDLSIDFVKGIAALSVVFLHNMPNYYIGSIAWIGQAVPLFLFVTAYLTYGSFERGKSIKDYYSKGSIVKMLNRVFKPFLIMTLIQCVIYYFFKSDFSIKNVIGSGGIGPGSYYPWLHLQAWLTLPLIIIAVDKMSLKKSMLLFILVCTGLEVISSIIGVPSSIYRLSFYRYLFVLYLACIIKKYDIRISLTLIVLAFISLVFLLVMIYTKINLEPLFYNDLGWRSCHWLSYFYTAFIFLLLVKFYRRVQESKLAHFFVLLGNYSYEIFLCQMFVYSIFSIISLDLTCNIYIDKVIYIISTTVFSIAPILAYKLWLKQMIKKA